MSEVDDDDDSGLDFEILPEVLQQSMTVTVYMLPTDHAEGKGITFTDVYESSVEEELKVLYLFCGPDSDEVILFQDYSFIHWQRNQIQGD